MKTILISGGSDGLGKAIATQLVTKSRVIILSPNEQKLRNAASVIGCEYKVCDVSDYHQIDSVVQEIGKVDCLINNAGLWLQGPLDETDSDRIKEVIEVNTLGTIYLTKALIPGMKQHKSGRIINIISTAGLTARNGWPVYTASKWAITGFTKAIQQELEPFGIGVTGIFPGTMTTEMFARAGSPKDVSEELDTGDVARTVEHVLSFDNSTLLTEIVMKKLKI